MRRISLFISITNNQGIATWTVTVDDIGLNSFSVTNVNVSINVKDKWNVLVNDGTYYIRAKEDTVQFIINTSTSTSFPTTFTAFSGGAKVPAEYRPSYSVVVPCKSNYPFYIAIRPDGTVERKTNASSSQSAGVYCFAEWTI